MLTMLKLEHMCKDIVTISYLPQHYIQICKMFNNYIATLEQCPQKKNKNKTCTQVGPSDCTHFNPINGVFEYRLFAEN